MSDLLNLGSSAIRSYQTAIEVIGDNIANASTEGYSRREAVLRAGPVLNNGNPLYRDLGLGSGVEVGSIRRAYDMFRTAQARTAGGDFARLEARQAWLSDLQASLGRSEISLGVQLTRFFNAAEDLASSPTATAVRSRFLETADSVAQRFRGMASEFDSVRAGLGAAVTDEVNQINAITRALADVNLQLTRAPGGTPQAAALADQRDSLLDKLASRVGVSITERAKGTIEVRLGGDNGPLLVDGATSTSLGVDSSNGSLSIVYNPDHAPRPVRLLPSGSLSGLLEASDRLEKTAAEVDLLADEFVAAVNAKHALGVDLNGQAGERMFDNVTLVTTMSRTSSGRATVDVTLTDSSALAASRYQLSYDGTTSSWTLSREDGSASVSGGPTLTLDGMTIEVGGAPLDGDSYSIAPRTGAAGVQLRLIDPEKIAAAAPWLADHAIGNSGSARIEVMANDAAVALPPLDKYVVRIIEPGMFELVDPATDSVVVPAQAYTDGALIDGYGFSFRLSAGASAGDSFTIERTPPGTSDNANIRALIDLRLPTEGGFEQGYDRIVTSVATALSETKSLADATKVVRDQAVAARDAISGVNLDEEAADLIRYQQAYQAASKVIATARALFDTIFDIV